MKTIFLIACSSTKTETANAAADLYCSEWFKKARKFAEANADEWFILSAKFGVVKPEEVLEPYNETLNAKDKTARRVWFIRATERMIKEDLVDFENPNSARFVILGGENYRESFEPELRESGFEVSLPLAGLGIGEQLSFLKRANA